MVSAALPELMHILKCFLLLPEFVTFAVSQLRIVEIGDKSSVAEGMRYARSAQSCPMLGARRATEQNQWNGGWELAS